MHSHRPTRLSRRAGLAPLEFVMAIPILMGVVGLSVVYGTAVCWKLKTSIVARDQMWSHRWPRNEPPFQDPRPEGWPATRSRVGVVDGGTLPDLADPAFNNRVIRGPLPNVRVNDELLDPTNWLRRGEAEITRTPAALGAASAPAGRRPVLPLLTDYTFDLAHPLLDGKWQYWQLGVRGNRGRRFPVLYPDLPDANPQLKALFDQSYQRIVTFPLRPALLVLDRDDEFIRWYGTAPDFHPRLSGFCSLDVATVRQGNVTGVIDDIQRVPKTMTEAFLRMYKDELNRLLAIPPGNRSPAQNARIAELRQKIAILEDFLATL